ncbi:MAG: hypothetical protein ABIV48_09550 [Pyrinomonadaceae bacterium]
MNEAQIKSLSDKIAQVIASESKPSNFESIQRSLDLISERLDRLESPPAVSDPKFQLSNTFHPSQDRFAIAEAILDSLFDQNSKEKACTFEPSKPCDHCSMCSSRGF